MNPWIPITGLSAAYAVWLVKYFLKPAPALQLGREK
jgi:hypothetical protein